MRARQSAILLLAVALLPAERASAQGTSCDYELELERAPVAATFPPPPPGYTYASQPATSQPPGGGVPLIGRLRGAEGCATSGFTISLEARDVGKPGFTVVRSTTADARGDFGFEPRPTRSAVVRAVATSPEGGTVASQSLTLPVRVAVSATYTRRPGCELVAAGSTYPSKPNHPVLVQVPSGGGYRTVARGYTAADGNYRLRWQAGCGRHDLVVTVPESASNTAGRTLFERQDVIAR